MREARILKTWGHTVIFTRKKTPKKNTKGTSGKAGDIHIYLEISPHETDYNLKKKKKEAQLWNKSSPCKIHGKVPSSQCKLPQLSHPHITVLERIVQCGGIKWKKIGGKS